MKHTILAIIKENGELDFEVSGIVQTLSQEEYKELKAMLITAIGSMEQMRRYKDLESNIKNIDKVLGGSDE